MISPDNNFGFSFINFKFGCSKIDEKSYLLEKYQGNKRRFI